MTYTIVNFKYLREWERGAGVGKGEGMGKFEPE